MSREMREANALAADKVEFELLLHRPEVWDTVYNHDGHAPGTTQGAEDFVFPTSKAEIDEMLAAIQKDLR